MRGFLAVWARHRNWIAAAAVVTVAVIWLATASFELIDRIQFVSSVPVQPVSAGHEIVQTFTAKEEGISRVDLVLSKEQIDSGGELSMELVDVEGETASGAPVAGVTLGVATLDNGSFKYPAIQRFRFEPVAVTPGKVYAVRLTSSDPAGAAVKPGSNPKDELAGGALYVDGRAESGDLYLSMFHDDGAAGLLERMQPWRPFPLGSAVFVVALFIIGAAAFGWLLGEMTGENN